MPVPAGKMQILVEWNPPADLPAPPPDPVYRCVIPPFSRPGPWQEAINNSRQSTFTKVSREMTELPMIHVEVQMGILTDEYWHESPILAGDFRTV